MKKWLYLPLDVKSRELHAKMLLAVAAADRNYKVVIGRKREVHKAMKFLPPGFYLGLGAQENFYEEYKNLRSKNYIVSAMDEEGLITLTDEIYKKLRVSANTLKETDIFFAWGNHQSQIIKKDPLPGKIQICPVGNLRLDTLTPQYRNIWGQDIDSIKKEHGRYVLIISSFGSANHFNGTDKFLKSLWEKKIVRNKEDENTYKNYIDLKKKNLTAYIDMIPLLSAAYPSINFIIRPHPSESHEAWKKISENFDNVKVIFDGSVQPWVLGSELIIHHFCTTAVEAYIGDIPAIAYRPFADDEIESQVPYKCSIEAFNKKELLEAVDDLLNGKSASLMEKRQINAEYYEGYIGNISSLDAAEKMIDCYDRLSITPPNFTVRSKLLFNRLRNILSRNTQGSDYLQHKFPPLSRNEVIKISKNILSLTSFKNVHVKKALDNCFVIESHD